jgi:hypothetical protein
MPSAPPDHARPLLFLHIRKAAGTSVRNWLLNRFPVAACLLDCHFVANRHVNPSAYQFVTGHIDFDYLEQFRERPICFVVLRHPVERALSAYYFFQRNDDRFLRWLEETIPSEQAEERIRFTRRANELSLLEFLERESALARTWLGNVQTRCLLSRPCDAARSDHELLDEAARNLESCEVVGLTERLGTSLARLASVMGWEADCDSIPHDNPTRDRPKLDEIHPRARDILTDWNQLDSQLYRVAERLFDSWTPQPPLRPARLPGCTDFTFDQPIHGGGWYTREKTDRGWFCWLGREAWLDLKPEGSGERILEAHVAHVLRPALLDGLEVRVNGRRLVTHSRGDGASRVIAAVVPASLVDADPYRVRVTFTMRETVRPCDLVPGNPDTRALGVAFDRIRLTPAKLDTVMKDVRKGTE